MAKAKQVFFVTTFIMVTVLLNGCAAVMLAGGEVAGAVVYGGQKMTGANLREVADWSITYEKKIETKVRLDRSDWVCAQGKGMFTGQEYCLAPKIVKQFKDSDWFTCSVGRGGGVLTRVATGDGATYCESGKGA